MPLMAIVAGTSEQAAVVPTREPRRRTRLTVSGAVRLRNAEWFEDHTIGRAGEDGIRVRKSIETIAAMHGVSAECVRSSVEKVRRSVELARKVIEAEGAGGDR